MNPQTATHKWFVVDAKGLTLGRMASRVAVILMGKHKPTYTAHCDCGDNVIIVNCAEVKVTGNKATQKEYQSYSGHHGGQHIVPFATMFARRPDHVVRLAVKRMMPVNRIGKQMLRKLHVYAGAEHPHSGQKPAVLNLAPKTA